MDFEQSSSYVGPLQEATNSHNMGQSFTDMLNDVTIQQHHDVTKPQQYGIAQQKDHKPMTYKNAFKFIQTFDEAASNNVCLFTVLIFIYGILI